jgi:hypothetical protein
MMTPKITSTVATVANPAERYRQVRGLTEALAEPLSAEDQVVQSMPDTSPTKWHRAHVDRAMADRAWASQAAHLNLLGGSSSPAG